MSSKVKEALDLAASPDGLSPWAFGAATISKLKKSGWVELRSHDLVVVVGARGIKTTVKAYFLTPAGEKARAEWGRR